MIENSLWFDSFLSDCGGIESKFEEKESEKEELGLNSGNFRDFCIFEIIWQGNEELRGIKSIGRHLLCFELQDVKRFLFFWLRQFLARNEKQGDQCSPMHSILNMSARTYFVPNCLTSRKKIRLSWHVRIMSIPWCNLWLEKTVINSNENPQNWYFKTKRNTSFKRRNIGFSVF